MKLISKIILVFITTLFVGICQQCEKTEQEVYHYPRTEEEIKKSYELSQQIVEESSEYIENTVSIASEQEESIDLTKIISRIKSINGVMSVEISSTGTDIIIEKVDSTYTTIPLIKQDDERLFNENFSKSDFFIDPLNKGDGFIIPSGGKKALILAPFQDQLFYDLNNISNSLENAGYSVEIIKNNDATLDRFRGNFLKNYDIVFFITHSGVSKTLKGARTSYLFTRERSTIEKLKALPAWERDAIVESSLYDYYGTERTYLGISVPWLLLTTDGQFPNSWIFASGCYTALMMQDSESLADAFFSLGVQGYNGFNTSIGNQFGNFVACEMAAKFSSGLSFIQSVEDVKKDATIANLKWQIRIFYKDFSEIGDINSFKYFQNSAEPFYLIEPTIQDIEGNIYKTVKIGDQIWMAENLRTTKYKDGSSISLVTNNSSWAGMTTGAYCWYNNDPGSYKYLYGALYNWYAGASAKLCPTGWHVPSDDEWHELILKLDPNAQLVMGPTNKESYIAGGILKEVGLDHWASPNYGAVDEVDFTGLPGGYRSFQGPYSSLSVQGIWWTTNAYGTNHGWARYVENHSSSVTRDIGYKNFGNSIRCVKDI